MNAIREALPEITLIAVAHRLSTVRTYDRIFLVDNGRITEQGEYDALYESSPLFRQMVDTAGSGS